MKTTDGITLALIHAILAAVFLWAIAKTLVARLRAGRGGATLTVKRGEQSMNFLYLSYGVTMVVFSLAIDVASVAVGHKATIIAIDYVLLTYLFIFNSWFRNAVVFRLLQDVSKD
jgi:hypothetical protein